MKHRLTKGENIDVFYIEKYIRFSFTGTCWNVVHGLEMKRGRNVGADKLQR
jgi:hypothetical protein